jgi:hypothetical protein
MIIGIAGKIGAGKDTMGEILTNILPGYWEIKKFAFKLKLITSILTGIPVEDLENRDVKESLMPSEWDDDCFNDNKSITYRTFMQRLGTDCIRNNLHSNAWVNALFADYYPLIQEYGIWEPSWIITDVRFPNEADSIYDRGGFLLQVVRDTGINDLHLSETALDTYPRFDFVFNNNMPLSQVKKEVRKQVMPLITKWMDLYNGKTGRRKYDLYIRNNAIA